MHAVNFILDALAEQFHTTLSCNDAYIRHWTGLSLALRMSPVMRQAIIQTKENFLSTI